MCVQAACSAFYRTARLEHYERSVLAKHGRYLEDSSMFPRSTMDSTKDLMSVGGIQCNAMINGHCDRR